ncbi:hypothetical protein EHQ92_12710 [Leptospira biflexa]|jgi:hypothetical protein|uniref:Lipoprotein n=1 Tax=Leptospira biflexa serovar Patoc (strain Patoc 1 / ATCC 23582 / Paris) TaxID=456481 RepID=B0SS99_LEPBP|nr:hypothetical protein [Leptospira biflexa]ABZ94337.1 Hypothetical lipoprotein [Leptospira biflexa serovar Patoc strain 'Patoc 1 (Ames)']ABZ97989.1 Hypothetical protein; putative signal peptide [Leptospira biflexa serovar Patoc strain 'Patoc 1 (Paris)']TGM36733.1 hypothetical protein EHQ89_08410 [Leptospira biflexa]TGM39717.1 hypothetical protein EHQ80_00515 [Leptospira biflexa]TGM48689.1 hypothetical protein EHQ92_12710 [Leptospira biflexa]
MKKSTILLLTLLFAISCASSESKDASSNEPGFMDKLIEKANSEEGQKAIQMGKEKLQDPETQEKIKGMMSKDKKKKDPTALPGQ